MAKKIDEYKFRGNGIWVTAPIYYEKGSAIARVQSGVFIIKIPEYGIEISGETLANLTKEVDKFLMEATLIKWENWLIVRVKSGTETNGGTSNAHLVIEVKPIEIGKNPNGDKFERSNGSYPSSYDIKQGTQLRSKAYFGQDTEVTTALIKDTPENRQAIEQLISDLEILNKRLSMLLSPDVIQNTLSANIAKLLPSNNSKLLAAKPVID